MVNIRNNILILTHHVTPKFRTAGHGCNSQNDGIIFFSLYVIPARSNFHMPIYDIPLITAIKQSNLGPMPLIKGTITPRQSGRGLKKNNQLHLIPTVKKNELNEYL